MSFEFAPRLRTLLADAESQACRLGSHRVETNHLLLALLDRASGDLEAWLGVNSDRLRNDLERTAAGIPSSGPLTPSRGCKRILFLAGEFRRWLADPRIDVVHLLLAFFDGREPTLARFLKVEGLDPDRAYEKLLMEHQTRRMDDRILMIERSLFDCESHVPRVTLTSPEGRGFETEPGPVDRLLKLILATAIRAGSSDVHFEPFEENCRVRYRVEGVLYEMAAPPLHLHAVIVERLKRVAGLQDSESSKVGVGKLFAQDEQQKVDLLVSTLPTVSGESVVLHIFSRPSA